jgi:hypothetical protein
MGPTVLLVRQEKELIRRRHEISGIAESRISLCSVPDDTPSVTRAALDPSLVDTVGRTFTLLSRRLRMP